MDKVKTDKNKKSAKAKSAKPAAKKTGSADIGKIRAAAGKPAKPVAGTAKPPSKSGEKTDKGAAVSKPPGKKTPNKQPAPKPRDPVSLPVPVLASGLGVSPYRKPGISLSPANMTLGRPAQPKSGPPQRPSERRLSKKELAEIQVSLSEKHERLLAGMKRELAMQKERAESKAADEVDKATDAYDEDLSFEIATANNQELKDIQVALEKIGKGTYGECEICGCAISPSRLKILPSATTCVNCRGQEEQARNRADGAPVFAMPGGEESAEPESEPE